MYEITLCLPSHQTVPPSGSHPIPPIPDRKASATLESSFPGPSVPMICEQSPTLPLPDYGHGSGPPPTWGPAVLHAAPLQPEPLQFPASNSPSYSQHLHLTGPTFCNGSCTPSCSHAAPPPRGNAPCLCVELPFHVFRALLIFSLCLSDCLSPIPSSDSPPGLAERSLLEVLPRPLGNEPVPLRLLLLYCPIGSSIQPFDHQLATCPLTAPTMSLQLHIIPEPPEPHTVLLLNSQSIVGAQFVQRKGEYMNERHE